MSKSVDALQRNPVGLFLLATVSATIAATVAAVSILSMAPGPTAVECRCACEEEPPAPAAEPAPPVKRVPRVRQAKVVVEGGLDRDIVRRIARAHINEVRYCYNQGLQRDPDLEGRVSVQFDVGANGRVATAIVQQSTLDDDDTAGCVARAVEGWKFPRPADAQAVTITYPFVLSPG